VSGAFQIGVAILAAGASSRMGKPKMLLPWGQTTVLGHEISVWRFVRALQVSVVIAQTDSGIAGALDRLSFPIDDRITNPDPSRGMFSSIQCAAQWDGWNNSITHFALALGDQPHLQPTTLRSLIDFSANNPDNVCQPAFAGSPRHPVIFPQSIFTGLGATNLPTLRDFLHSISEQTVHVELNDPGLALDIDRPEDYEEALRIGMGSEPA
jgi:molybdenum cofactor cytidylyltransferase